MAVKDGGWRGEGGVRNDEFLMTDQGEKGKDEGAKPNAQSKLRRQSPSDGKRPISDEVDG
jgi:hypothetical protein